LTAKQTEMPSKNYTSTSFAVSQDKVQRRKYAFNPQNMLLDNHKRGISQAAYDTERAKYVNRHSSRNDGVSQSIDFVFHTEIKGARLASDGGACSIGSPGLSQRATKRLGTAEFGHGRQFLITDFTKHIKNPHFNSKLP